CSPMSMRKCGTNIMVAASWCRRRLRVAACLIWALAPAATSQLVGPQGEVVGVDMTDGQLETARSHIDWHMQSVGNAKPNVNFLKGYIERLDALGLRPQSFDVIVSNCVINLSVDKPAVLRGAYELLKPGGELYFADVYCDRRLPDAITSDPVL